MPLPRLIRLACLALSIPSLAFAAPNPPPVQLKDFLGLCGHTVQFKPERYTEVTSVVRDYHPVEWDPSNDTSTPTPLPFAKNKVNWDYIYGSWKKAGARPRQPDDRQHPRREMEKHRSRLPRLR